MTTSDRAKKELQENFYKWQQTRMALDVIQEECFEMDRRATVQLLFTIACLLIDSGIVPQKIPQ